MEFNELLILKKSTDATATNRGFLFQYLKTLEIWLYNYINKINKDIYCETEDDIKQLDQKLQQLKFSQIKCYSSSFNLHDEDIENAIYNFFILFSMYKENYESTFLFETNSTVLKSDAILQEWVKEQNMLSDELLDKFRTEIASILTKVISGDVESKIKKLDKKIKGREKKIEETPSKAVVCKDEILEIKKEIENIKKRELEILHEVQDVDNLTDFIKRIRWSFEDLDSDEAIEQLKERNLSLIRSIDSVENAPNTMLGRFLTVIYEKSSKSSTNERCLNNDILSSIIDESQEEMIRNSNGIILSLLNNRFDIIETKLTDGFSRLESKLDSTKLSVQNPEFYVLPHYEQEEIEVHLKREDFIKQSNLDRKIKQIGIIGEEDESYLIELATEIRCCYLIYMEKLKLENLMNEYANMKIM